MARNAHVQGTVALAIDITESGTVTRVMVISGHPILITAAIDAVKKWRYKPFLTEGRLAAVHTVILVPFYMGSSPDTETIRTEAESVDLFERTLRLCRIQIRDQQPEPAEATCRKALNLTSGPPNDKRAKCRALEQLGNVLFMQHKFPEALESYQQELHLAETDGGVDLAVADARNNVANALWHIDRADEARKMYEKSESIYRKAIRSESHEPTKNFYLRRLKGVLLNHAAMLRHLGETAAAEALEKEGAAIAVSDIPSD